MPSQVLKDPAAHKPYFFDWSQWLWEGEVVTAHTIDVPAGLTLTSTTASSTVVTAWLSGGDAGADYSVVCRVTTDQGREDERTLVVRVRDR